MSIQRDFRAIPNRSSAGGITLEALLIMPLVCVLIWGLIQAGWIWTQYHRLNDLALLSARDAAAQVPVSGVRARADRLGLKSEYLLISTDSEAGRWRSTLRYPIRPKWLAWMVVKTGGVPWLSATQSARSRPIESQASTISPRPPLQ